MKKSIIFGLLILSNSALFGESFKDLTDMQNFYYQKGYNESAEKFYKLGYEKAIRDMTAKLKIYKKNIDSYEAGKYYMSVNKITFPRVFKTKDSSGNYVIHIENPEVKEKLSLEDIFALPEIELTNCNQNTTFDNSTNGQLGNSVAMNSIYQSVNTTNGYITSPISQLKEFGIVFPKTERIKKILDSATIKYAELPNGIKAYFKNENEFKTFCKINTGDEKCLNLFAR